MSVDAMMEQALKLSVEEREELIDRLAAAHVSQKRMDPEWEASWTAEIERRLADVREGRVKPIEADEAFARLRAAADRHR